MTTHSSIDGDTFAAALVSGIHRVLGQQELLNRINVFPVADSDTGTNLSLSLSAALGILQRDRPRHLGTLLAETADALLDGARGNSGAIMAQFFQGFSDSASELPQLTGKAFAAAVRSGSNYAHDALSTPRAGTILSVIAAFADSIERRVAESQQVDFATLFVNARERVEQALAETPDQLEVLRKAGVVDAGAKGFTELVGGMTDYFSTGRIAARPDLPAHMDFDDTPDIAAHDANAKYRFCTECLVVGDDIDRRKLREALNPLGDSLVLAGSKRKAKIHIHVNEPDTVFEIARNFGELRGEKADDMHQQQRTTHGTEQRFAVVTDSGADIHDDDLERLDIHSVPVRIQFGDRGYLDKVSITTDEFYQELRSNPHHPTTSQPAPGDFRRQFQFLASHFADVLSINLTSTASGTYQAAMSAASRVQASGDIHVIDSRNASVGQGLLVVLAAECARAGLSVEQTREIVERQVPKVRIFALLEDLTYAARGGRLPGWVRTLAKALNLLPIITLNADGRVALATFLFGRRNRVARFVRFVNRRLPQGEELQLAVGHAVAREEADAIVDNLRILGKDITDLRTCDLGTALGVHGGPGTLIVAAQPRVSFDDVAGGVD